MDAYRLSDEIDLVSLAIVLLEEQRISDCSHATTVQKADLVAEKICLLHVMRCEHDDSSDFDPVDHLPNPPVCNQTETIVDSGPRVVPEADYFLLTCGS